MGTDWNTSYSNKIGRLCQVIGIYPTNPAKQLVKGTNTFRTIRYDKIPLERRNGIAFSKAVCTFFPDKSYPNRTRITIVGQNIKWPGEVSTKTASLDLIKLLLNSVISRRGAKFVTFDINNFYLQTLLDRPEYVRIKLADIPQDFIDKYSLQKNFDANVWVCLQILNGVYRYQDGIP